MYNQCSDPLGCLHSKADVPVIFYCGSLQAETAPTPWKWRLTKGKSTNCLWPYSTFVRFVTLFSPHLLITSTSCYDHRQWNWIWSGDQRLDPLPEKWRLYDQIWKGWTGVVKRSVVFKPNHGASGSWANVWKITPKNCFYLPHRLHDFLQKLCSHLTASEDTRKYIKDVNVVTLTESPNRNTVLPESAFGSNRFTRL